MTAYLILLVCILLYGVAIFARGVTQQRKKIYLFMAFGHMALLMGLRAPSVGTDAANYARIFVRIGTQSDWINTIKSAPVYNIYNKILYWLVPHEQAVLMVTAIIICAAVAVFIYHFSDNVVISTYCYIALYFYFTSFNISRQFMAMAFLLYSACLLKQKRSVFGWIMAIGAVGIHNTAIVFLPFLLLKEHTMTRRRTTRLLIGGVALEIGVTLLFVRAVSLFAALFPRYAMYLNGLNNHSVLEQGQGNNIILGLFYLGVLAVALFILYYKKEYLTKQREQRLQLLTVISLFSVLSYLLLTKNLAVMRVQRYFEVYLICLIPAVVEPFRRMRYLIYFLLVLILLLPLFFQLAGNLSGVLPYQFFWE
ncbi:MAG: EpsG family protein [Oscillospiraceae bacterium]|nr:EpsG family protein [Oscillospiraceae bacterium]